MGVSSLFPLSANTVRNQYSYRHSILEVDIGLICSCTLALPAFFDKQFPNGLLPYFSKLTSLLSSRNKSRGTGYASHEGNSTRNLHKGSESSRRYQNDYWELESKKGYMNAPDGSVVPGTGRGDLEAARGKLGRNPCTTQVTVDGGWESGDRDDWLEEGIMKTVKINRHDGE